MGKIRRAIVSVSDKSGVASFAKELSKLGVEILSTGGTAKTLREQGTSVKDISEYTGFPEMKWSGAEGPLLKGVNFFLKGVKWTGYVSLSGVILLTTINVFGRYILRKPLLGEYDMVELGMAVFGGVAMLIAAIQRHHVSVDVLLVRLSRRIQLALGSIASLLGFVTWCLIAYLAFRDGLDRLKNGSHSATLRIPQGPFEIILAISLFLFCLTLLTQAFRPEGPKKEKEGGPQA